MNKMIKFRRFNSNIILYGIDSSTYSLIEVDNCTEI